MRFSSFFLVLINSASTTLALPYDLHTSLAFNEYDDSFDDPLFLSNSNTEPDTPSLRPIGYSEFPEIPDSHSELIAATSGGVRTSDVVTIPIANLFPNSCKQQSLKGLCCDGSGSGNTKLGCVEYVRYPNTSPKCRNPANHFCCSTLTGEQGSGCQ